MSKFKSFLKPWERKRKGQSIEIFDTNDSNPHNSSHKVDQNTNFNLRSITLTDIDLAVQQEFTGRFNIDGELLNLYFGDAPASSLQNMNLENFDEEKDFLQLPFFIFSRTASTPKYRTNPGKKYIIYAAPKKKAQGTVIEEYITTGPQNWELIYDFKFATHYRESANEMEIQFQEYFMNKRNIINFEGERFSIGSANPGQLTTLEVVNGDTDSDATVYVVTCQLRMFCYTRDLSQMQKRERPNSYTIDIKVRDDMDSSKGQNIERFVIANKGVDISSLPPEVDE